MYSRVRLCNPRYLSFSPGSPHSLIRPLFGTQNGYLQITEEVRQAISEKRPVVALETTIYTHGFPYPDNLSLASRLESLVRENGAIPATIGVLDGVARVGFNDNDLQRLVASASSESTWKLSRRDLAFACSLSDPHGRPYNGGTTVAGTMILAHLAGIRIFATGGLGGVHRGVDETMDVSADLTELGRTPVAVVSSGCKSFLDIPKTLEFLETQGVAVATFADGRAGKIDFPAFYSRDSGIASPKVIKDELEAARTLNAHFSLGLQSGLVLANPVPEQYSIPYERMELTIDEALSEAKRSGVYGAAATPYILARIKALTGDKSVETNRVLIESNVVRGTKLAVALSQLERKSHGHEYEIHPVMTGPAASNYTLDGVSKGVSYPNRNTDESVIEDFLEGNELSPAVFVAGSLALDLACDYTPRVVPSNTEIATSPALHTSNPARIAQSLGGVGSNVARAAHLMGARVQLCSAVADDLPGKAALKAMNASGITTKGIKVFDSKKGSRTAQYIAVNDVNKDLVLAVADMSILESTSSDNDGISGTLTDFWMPKMQASKPSHLVIDANWPAGLLARWLETGNDVKAHITFEPVSTVKGANVFKLPEAHALAAFPNHKLHLATPNSRELAAMHAAAVEAGAFERPDWWQVIDAFGIPHSGARVQLALATNSDLVDQGIPQQSLRLLPFIPSICTKLGADGVLLTQLIPANDERLQRGEYAPYILSRCANGTEDTLGVGGVYIRLFPVVEDVKQDEIVSVNGVGDTFAGALVAGMAQAGPSARVEDFIDVAQRAAVLTLKSSESVSPQLGSLRVLL